MNGQLNFGTRHKTDINMWQGQKDVKVYWSISILRQENT